MADHPKLSLGLRRGLGLRCPQCGEGHLFCSFLKVSPHCDACGADNTIYPSDDLPTYLTLILVGHLFAPFIFWLDDAWQPSMWTILAISLPAISAVSLATLPIVKGAVVGFAWATNVTRETAGQ